MRPLCRPLFVLVALLAVVSGASPARAQDRCAGALQRADDAFAAGEDAEVVVLLNGCVSQRTFPEGDVVPAFRLLVQAHLRAGDEQEATMALVRLLAADPLYEPDPDRDPRSYGLFVGEVKSVLMLPSRAAFRCDREMLDAQRFYDEDALDETIAALTNCIEKPQVDIAEAVRAHRMLALTHLRAGALADAREAVVALLRQAPDYEADPVRDLPTYTSLVGLVRQQLAGGLAN